MLIGGALLPLVFYAAVRGQFWIGLAAWAIAFPAGIFGYRLLRKTDGQARFSDLDIFFGTILKGNGWRITASQLAGAAAITPEAAKNYLDEKLLTLDGRFEVSTEGEELYVFELRKPG